MRSPRARHVVGQALPTTEVVRWSNVPRDSVRRECEPHEVSGAIRGRGRASEFRVPDADLAIAWDAGRDGGRNGAHLATAGWSAGAGCEGHEARTGWSVVSRETTETLWRRAATRDGAWDPWCSAVCGEARRPSLISEDRAGATDVGASTTSERLGMFHVKRDGRA